ncbi:MAG: PTS fructose transporter subunit IIA [Burkholderiaceae bacterium]|nr:PTS fructose transporter subunit IIA [Burkholderiaceae bacterium]
MIGILVVSHEPLGTALIHCTRHIFGRMLPQLAALDVIPDEDPGRAEMAGRELIARINDGSGVLVLTDICGATPARVAARLADSGRICVLAGANLPLLLRALSRRRGAEIESLIVELLPLAREAIGRVRADGSLEDDMCIPIETRNLDDADEQGGNGDAKR